jgi:type II secretion system protein C
MVRALTKHFWIFNLLFIAAFAWLVAHLATLVLQDRLVIVSKSSLPKKNLLNVAERIEPYERYAPIPENNIFNPSEKGLKLLPLDDKKKLATVTGGLPGGAKTSSAGSLRLMGTITGPGRHSWAVLQEGADPKQKIYRLHEAVDGGKIVQISRNQVRIQRQGRDEILSFVEEEIRPAPSAGPVAKASPVEGVKKLSPNRFVIDREDVVSSVGDINQFSSQARFRPHFVGGRPTGFAVSEIQPGSLMDKVGLKNNDVIRKINGQVITKPEEVFQAYAQLMRDGNIEVEIERGNRVELYQYEVR